MQRHTNKNRVERQVKKSAKIGQKAEKNGYMVKVANCIIALISAFVHRFSQFYHLMH